MLPAQQTRFPKRGSARPEFSQFDSNRQFENAAAQGSAGTNAASAALLRRRQSLRAPVRRVTQPNHQGKQPKKTTILVAGALCLSFAGSAQTDEYYVVQNPTTHHCTIVSEKPKADMVVTQIGPIAFASRTEAESRIKTTKVCTDTTTGSGGTVIKEKHIDKD